MLLLVSCAQLEEGVGGVPDVERAAVEGCIVQERNLQATGIVGSVRRSQTHRDTETHTHTHIEDGVGGVPDVE